MICVIRQSSQLVARLGKIHPSLLDGPKEPRKLGDGSSLRKAWIRKQQDVPAEDVGEQIGRVALEPLVCQNKVVTSHLFQLLIGGPGTQRKFEVVLLDVRHPCVFHPIEQFAVSGQVERLADLLARLPEQRPPWTVII
jgi:hypothetical protein